MKNKQLKILADVISHRIRFLSNTKRGRWITMMDMIASRWCKKKEYGASFWVVHILGSMAIFLWGMRTASKSSVSIAMYRFLRMILAR